MSSLNIKSTSQTAVLASSSSEQLSSPATSDNRLAVVPYRPQTIVYADKQTDEPSLKIREAQTPKTDQEKWTAKKIVQQICDAHNMDMHLDGEIFKTLTENIQTASDFDVNSITDILRILATNDLTPTVLEAINYGYFDIFMTELIKRAESFENLDFSVAHHFFLSFIRLRSKVSEKTQDVMANFIQKLLFSLTVQLYITPVADRQLSLIIFCLRETVENGPKAMQKAIAQKIGSFLATCLQTNPNLLKLDVQRSVDLIYLLAFYIQENDPNIVGITRLHLSDWLRHIVESTKVPQNFRLDITIKVFFKLAGLLKSDCPAISSSIEEFLTPLIHNVTTYYGALKQVTLLEVASLFSSLKVLFHRGNKHIKFIIESRFSDILSAIAKNPKILNIQKMDKFPLLMIALMAFLKQDACYIPTLLVQFLEKLPREIWQQFLPLDKLGMKNLTFLMKFLNELSTQVTTSFKEKITKIISSILPKIIQQIDIFSAQNISLLDPFLQELKIFFQKSPESYRIFKELLSEIIVQKLCEATSSDAPSAYKNIYAVQKKILEIFPDWRN